MLEETLKQLKTEHRKLMEKTKTIVNAITKIRWQADKLHAIARRACEELAQCQKTTNT